MGGGGGARWPLVSFPIAIGVGTAAVAAAATGSLWIPHNDAWSYSAIAERFGEDGTIHLLGWNRFALVGQIVPLGPAARWIVVQHLFVVVLASVALVATHAVLEPRLGWRRALFGTLVVAAFPGYGLLATSFMGDVPAFAAMVGCLALGDAAIRRRSTALLAGALLVGAWGVTVREQALVALGALLVGAWSGWPAARARLACASAAFAVLLLTFEVWRRSLAGDTPPDAVGWAFDVHDLARLWVTFGLAVAPAAVLVAAPRRWSSTERLGAAIGALVAALSLVALQTDVFIGNYLHQHGAYTHAALGARRVFGGQVWRLVAVVAALSTVPLAAALASRCRSLGTMYGSFVVGTVGVLLVQLAVGQPTFDRNLLPLVPFALLVVLDRPIARPFAGAVALAGLSILSLVLMLDTQAFDAARWHAARQLVDRGVDARDVDAGMEWVGYHAGVAADPGRPPIEGASTAVALFGTVRPCLLVTASPVDGARLTATRSYGWGPWSGQVLVYDGPAC